MLILNDVQRARLLGRYRILFRATTMAFGASVLFVGVGLLAAIFAADAAALLVGLLTTVLSILTGYKLTLSTMRIIDAEGEQAWRDLGI